MKKFNYKNIPRRMFVIAAVVVFAGAGSYFLATSKAAGTATLTVTPVSAPVNLGSNVTVTVTANSGATLMNAVEADLTYDASKLTFVSIDTSTSPFELHARASGGGGTVFIASGTATPRSGSQVVATVTFTATGLGSTPIGFAPTSGIAESTNNTDILGTATGNTVVVSDGTAPTTPTGLTAGVRTATSIALSWTASTDNVGVTGYKIFRGGVQVGTSTTTSFTNTGLTPSTSYSYTVTANDAANNNSTASAALSTSTTADTTAPTVPTGLTAGTRTLTTIPISWTASTDNVAVTGYRIFRGGVQIGTSTTTSYTDTGLTPGTSYSYTVTANDAVPNHSAASAALATSTLADTTAPTVPTGLTSPSQTTNSVTLTWNASTDNVAVTGYKIFRGGVQVGTSATTSFTNTGLTPGTAYTFTVSAYDAVNNNSAQSSSISVTPPRVPGDADGDGHVTFLDMSILSNGLINPTDLRADFNGSGRVDFLDFSIMASNWGA